MEERIEESADNVDPIDIGAIPDDELVALYSSSTHGHELFLNSDELWELISERNIEISEYRSVYDNGEIPVPSGADINNETLDITGNGEDISTSSEDFPEHTSDKPHKPSKPDNSDNVGISDGQGSDNSDVNGTESVSAPPEPVISDDNNSLPQESLSQPDESTPQPEDSGTAQGGTGSRPIDNSVSDEESAEIGSNSAARTALSSSPKQDTHKGTPRVKPLTQGIML